MKNRKFDYEEFQDGYGMVFDRQKYSDEQAIKITAEEWKCNESDLEVVADEMARYYQIAPKWAQEDGMKSGYIIGEKGKGSFPVIVVNYK